MIPRPTELCMVCPFKLAAAILVDAVTITQFGRFQLRAKQRTASTIRDLPAPAGPVIISGELSKQERCGTGASTILWRSGTAIWMNAACCSLFSPYNLEIAYTEQNGETSSTVAAALSSNQVVDGSGEQFNHHLG